MSEGGAFDEDTTADLLRAMEKKCGGEDIELINGSHVKQVEGTVGRDSLAGVVWIGCEIRCGDRGKLEGLIWGQVNDKIDIEGGAWDTEGAAGEAAAYDIGQIELVQVTSEIEESALELSHFLDMRSAASMP